MKKTKKTLVILLLITLSATLLACSYQRNYEGFVFGTSFSLHINEKSAKKTINNINSALVELDRTISTSIDDSDITRINEAGTNVPISVSEATIFLIKEAKSLYEATDGIFNPAIFPLVELWKFAPANFIGIATSIPTNTEIENTLLYSSFDLFQLDEEALTVTKLHESAKLDLGGIGKGYAIDVALSYVKENGFIVVGGEIGVKGDSKRIGIRSPRTSSVPFGIYVLKDNEFISTSGDYERFYFYNDKRYHHIIAPDGYPSGHFSANPVINVTLVVNSALIADALSTAFMAMEFDDIVRIADIYNAKGVIIYQDKQYRTFGGFEFELTNYEYNEII